MSKKNKKVNTTYEVLRHMRGDWGNVNPVTKIIPNKKKNYIPDEYDEYYSIDDCNNDIEREYRIESTIDFDDWSDY